jgi:hypothetical protein
MMSRVEQSVESTVSAFVSELHRGLQEDNFVFNVLVTSKGRKD